ncbi:MAG: DNA cytosine methyltransferase [Anaerolineaceae bacterium]|nr:DNA cytosine methyltransferase [Anaerolineaceae bacterium]
MITTIDLFAGAGLMTEGFRQAGFRSIFAGEADPRAVASFNRNIENVAQVWDVRKVKLSLCADVIVAGPPCQGFSTLGKKDSNDERNKLSLTVLKWLKSAKPKVVVIENVPQFVDSKYWKSIQKGAHSEGYESCHWILNSVDFGAPQKRIRVFCILSRIGIPQKPQATHKKPVTIADAFRGLSGKPDGKMQHVAPTPTGVALQRIQIIPKNGDKRDVMRRAPQLCPPSWAKMGAQAVDVWGRMRSDAPSNTLRCCFQNASKGRYLHPTENRVISLREGARLQGVPDAWIFEGDRSSIARQIGNGVPVPLARAVAGAIQSLFVGFGSAVNS